MVGRRKLMDYRHANAGRRAERVVSRGGRNGEGVSVVTQTDGSRQNDEGLKRDASFMGLLLTSEGSIIGSGWLFGALYVSTIGGPAAVIAWLIGSFAVILLALVHAELGGMFPVSGGTARFPHYAFGGLAGASFGWFSWLQAVGTAPIEVEAAIQYSSNYVHGLTYTVHNTVVLTGLGYLVAVALMALFTVINLYGVRRLMQANNAITTWKIVIPTLTIVVLFFTHFDVHNFTRGGGFAPYGTKGCSKRWAPVAPSSPCSGSSRPSNSEARAAIRSVTYPARSSAPS